MIRDVEAKFVARWELSGVSGVVVAVDVLRAFTTAAYAFAGGASMIWLAGEVNEALALEVDLVGRALVQRTSAGTRGVLAATDARAVYAASLVTASTTARAVARHGAGPPTYVVTGRFPDRPDGGEDDLLTAQLIERARLGQLLESAKTAELVAATREAELTLALGAGDVHPDDVAYATAVDKFGFAMRAEPVDGQVRLVREEVS
jgi:2-phosphosulfolactate phosphatase